MFLTQGFKIWDKCRTTEKKNQLDYNDVLFVKKQDDIFFQVNFLNLNQRWNKHNKPLSQFLSYSKLIEILWFVGLRRIDMVKMSEG